VYEEFNRLIRSEGAGKAKFERNVVVERAVAKNIRQHDVEVAITIMLLTEQLTEKITFLPVPMKESINASSRAIAKHAWRHHAPPAS
jgi:hypothetical protein